MCAVCEGFLTGVIGVAESHVTLFGAANPGRDVRQIFRGQKDAGIVRPRVYNLNLWDLYLSQIRRLVSHTAGVAKGNLYRSWGL